MGIADRDAFNVLDIVETNYSGKLTRHIITSRYKVRNSQTGVVYEVAPPVPRSGDGDRVARIDHAWFKRVGRLVLKDEVPTMASAT